jgi:hypothetical protein
LRESVVLFILASEVDTISIPLNLQGNESFKKEIGSSFPTSFKFNLSVIERKKC